VSNDGDNELTAQQRAEKKRSEKRKGNPIFTTVRFKHVKDKKMVDRVFKLHGGTREEALIDAAKALENELKKEQ